MCRGAAVLVTPTFTIMPGGFNSFQIGEPAYRGGDRGHPESRSCIGNNNLVAAR
ncbi:MAG: hypothetical protein M3R66_14910 [Actinomycetota bacterium]|nr:hypothetical protein [Actinomycetota bacterium]